MVVGTCLIIVSLLEEQRALIHQCSSPINIISKSDLLFECLLKLLLRLYVLPLLSKHRSQVCEYTGPQTTNNAILRVSFEQSIKQTKAEVKEDMKAMEGNPTIRTRSDLFNVIVRADG